MAIVIKKGIGSFTNKGKDKIGGGGMDIGQTKKKKKKKKQIPADQMPMQMATPPTPDEPMVEPMMGGGKVMKYRKGGKVRGAGIARQGVRKCKYV
tara:strand:- start:67 stop:351 length:285 start_codon:yes stop_codon:yes gene_type:complete